MTQESLAQIALDLDEEQTQAASVAISVDELDSMLRTIRELDEEYKERKRISNEAHAQLEAEKAKMLPILEALGRNNYALAGVGVISRVTENSFKFPEDLAAREKVFQYIRTQYGKDALYALTTIHAAKFNSFVKEEVAQSKQVDGVPNPTVETYIKFGRK
jgi:hypothetical protein